MQANRDLKMYQPRHFLFYMGVAAIMGAAIGVAKAGFEMSDGLTFVVAVIAGTVSSTLAVREGLFGASKPSDQHRA